MASRRVAAVVAAAGMALLVGASGSSPAQQQAAPAATTERPAENLQVLPKDWTGRQVVERVMRNWTAALGVRCPHCHVGQEGQPLSGFDFASDAKPEKQRAREMYRMLQEINLRLASMPEMHGAKASSATCQTCHHGVPRPLRIEDVFEATRARSGLDAALAEYRELREKNLTRGAYDFGSMPLVRIAGARLAADDAAGAMSVLNSAVEMGLDSLALRAALADAALAKGDRVAAVAHLEKALTYATNPAEREFVEGKLRAARDGEPPPR